MYLNLSYEKKNPDVTVDQLKKNMSGKDLDAFMKTKTVSLEDLWESYCQVKYVKNPFGITCIPGTENKFKMKMVDNLVTDKFKENPTSPFTKDFLDMLKANPVRKDPFKTKPQKGGKLKKRTRKKNQKGGVVIPEDTLIISPSWRNGPGPDTFNTLVNIIPNNGANSIQVFGSSLPYVNVDDETRCFNTLAFYMYRHEIRRIISFQACGLNPGGNHLQTYDATYPTMENDTWNMLKLLKRDHRLNPSYVFTDLFCRDMTQGTINFWNDLDAINFIGDDNRSLLHCYAGYGRTGSALFFLILKEAIATGFCNVNVLLSPFIGLGNSNDMYDQLKHVLNHRIEINQNPVNGAFQAEINNFDATEIADEVFNINGGDTYNANLLISRINLIFTVIGNRFMGPGNQICLYSLHAATPAGGFTPANIFHNPVFVVI